MADRPRLIDVAQRAGVSIATASQAFTGHRPVSARTKAAVLKAAFDLGFVADSGARGCAVGMLIRPPEAIPGFGTGPDAFSTISGAVLISLLAAGYSVTSFRSLDDIGQQVGRLDAFVLLHPNRSDEVLRALVARGIPTVAYDQDPGDADFRWWVGPNYRRSMGALRPVTCSCRFNPMCSEPRYCDQRCWRRLLGGRQPCQASALARSAAQMMWQAIGIWTVVLSPMSTRRTELPSWPLGHERLTA